MFRYTSRKFWQRQAMFSLWTLSRSNAVWKARGALLRKLWKDIDLQCILLHHGNNRRCSKRMFRNNNKTVHSGIEKSFEFMAGSKSEQFSAIVYEQYSYNLNMSRVWTNIIDGKEVGLITCDEDVTRDNNTSLYRVENQASNWSSTCHIRTGLDVGPKCVRLVLSLHWSGIPLIKQV